MEITGTQPIPAPRDVVWAALNNPEVLKKCLPGCESVEAPTPAIPQWGREKFSALLEMAQHGGVEGLRIVDVGQMA